MSREYAAFEFEISRSTYKRYEWGDGEPKVFALIKMADYFGVTIDYPVGRTNG